MTETVRELNDLELEVVAGGKEGGLGAGLGDLGGKLGGGAESASV